MDVMDRIDNAVKDNPVVIFMKGSPQIPQCGYSSRAAQALAACGQEFAHVNVLADLPSDLYQWRVNRRLRYHPGAVPEG